MIHLFTRMTSIMLAFGFFFGCSTTKKSSEQQDITSPESLTKVQIKQRLSALEQQIHSNPKNSSLYLQKGALLTRWAQKEQPPARRAPLYFRADKTLSTAEILSRTEKNTPTKDQIDQLRRVAWSNEHNQGVQLLQNARSPKQQQQAAIHFENATAIMPDSAISYLMASRAFYKSRKLPKAIAELERARANIPSLPSSILESLGFLYMETDQPEQAIPVFKEAQRIDSLNYSLMHGLANAYIKTKKHPESVALLRTLAEEHPSETTYRRSLAGELYRAAKEKISQAADSSTDQQISIQQSLSEVKSLFQEADNNYKYLLDKGTDNRDIKEEVARYYQNAASQYQKLLTHLDEQAQKEVSDAIMQKLSAAVPLLEELVAQESEKEWWQSLYQAYTYLGMQQKAEEAKANF